MSDCVYDTCEGLAAFVIGVVRVTVHAQADGCARVVHDCLDRCAL